MNCPDTNRLIDLAQGGGGDEELRTHLQQCPSCRSALELIRELPAAFDPELEVPEELVKKTMAAVFGGKVQPARRRLAPVHSVLAGVLGTVTALLTIGLSGIPGPDAVTKLLMFSVAVGLVSGMAGSMASLRDPG